ncbi:reverse transcriptase-like protein [Sphingomonas corticis]|jgi:ribonuclease HI|nr:reverse transcriptase-like protein [Sphingomonas corticis]
MEWAVVIRGEAIVACDLGAGTSMEAEWLALLAALRLVRERRIADAVLLGDAAAVIAQARGEVRCPPAYREHLDTFHALGGAHLRLRYLRRAQNLAGIALDALRR